VTARELDDAGAMLEHRRIRARDEFATAMICGFAAAAVLTLSPVLALSLAVGAAAAVLLALIELTSSWVHVRPDSAAACHYLLTHAAESPLNNAALPAEQLETTLERILRGITA
jgi:hypothetical protein